MFNISKLLGKLSQNLVSVENIYLDICTLIYKETNITIPKECFEIKNNILYIQTSPVFKNKIYLKKNVILKQIDVLYPKKVLDIR